MNKLRNLLYKAPAFLYTEIVLVIIMYLTLYPHPLPENDIKWWEHTDKVVHAIMFGVFNITCIYDYARKFKVATVDKETILKTSTISIAVGGSIEIVQTCMELGRSGDWADFDADIIGVILFALISNRILSFLVPRR